MRHASRYAVIACMALLSACTQALPREEPPRLGVDADWMQLPANAAFAEVSAVDVDSHGHVFVLHRAGRKWEEPFPAKPISQPTVFMFDGQSGQLLARWGAGQLVMPHGLSVDLKDKVWITDVAREQVLRFSHDGGLELELGQRGVTGGGPAHFGRPADVAFSGDRVLVADGYLNNRVAVLSRAGTYLGEFGGKGQEAGEFNLPHAIMVSGGRIYVADRENGRIQVLSETGQPLAIWSQPGRGHPYAVKPLSGGRFLAVEGRDSADRYGAILRVYRADGSLEASYEAGLPGENASLGHDLAIAADGTVYMADNRGNRVVRFRLPRSESK